MSLKAKLEAVIYAAEEPVTLTQLAALFAADALEWKAAQITAAAEQVAEVASDADNASLHLLDEELASLGLGSAPEAEAATTGIAAIPPEATQEAAQEVIPEATQEATPQAEDESGPQDALAGEAASGSGDDPDSEAEMKRLTRQRDRDVKAVLKQLLDELVAECADDGRGIEIKEIAGGYRMATKPECHDAVRMFVKSLKPALKLSLAALETLAVVAYKQPVTAPEVSEIRGVEAAGVLGSLLARKLIATAGRKAVIGRPILYKTTKEFLLRFGLKDVSELPSMDEFEKMAAIEIEEMEPEAAAADAAEDQAEEAAQKPGDESGNLFNTPNSDGNAAGPEDNHPENDPDTDLAADSTAARPAEPDAPAPSNLNEAAPAEPDSNLQAETETSPHAEEEQEER